MPEGIGYLDQLGRTFSQQSETGLDPAFRAGIRTRAVGDIDRRFGEDFRTSREAISSAGLGASGLSTIAGIKLAGGRGRAVGSVNTDIAGLDFEAKQKGLQGLLGVTQEEQRRLEFEERKRQFEEQLAFQKDQARYDFGDFFGDVLGAGAQIGTAALFASDLRLKENLVKVDEVDGINVYHFNYIDDEKKYQGVVAQEIQKDHPEAVGEKGGYLAVDYNKIPVDFKEVV